MITKQEFDFAAKTVVSNFAVALPKMISYKSYIQKAILNIAWKNRSRLGQCAGADWDTFDAAKLMIFSETVAF